MVKFILGDGETVWLNPSHVISVSECKMQHYEDLSEVEVVGGSTFVIADKPNRVVSLLSCNQK